MTDDKDKILLGQKLIEKNIITEEQLDIALKKQEDTGSLLGSILLELGFIDEEAVFYPFLASQFGVGYVDLKRIEIPGKIINKIPAKFAIHYKIIPLAFEDGILTIATSSPLDIQAQDGIGIVIKDKIKPALAREKDILEAIRRYYGVGAETIEQMMGTVKTANQFNENVSNIEEIDSDASISKFLNQILLEAYRDRATDIHIEPFEDTLHIRYRIDGILYDAKVPSDIKHFKDSINSRIKILSNLNIAEKRMPQDGRFKVLVGGVNLDLRISFLPTQYGESVVLRILNAAKLFTFEELKLSDKEHKALEELVKIPHGIIFLTGPTGSGKTTTLYSCLASINTEDKKIITIEDPIEYQLTGITQVQINPRIGLSFAHGLRSMLRHDPDVMMVGEVRDIETAEIAIQVALTGHLIFSTLHTNDAASGVTRLLDMGIEPYLITSTVECFIAQRLARVLCPKCKQPVEDSLKAAKKIGKQINVDSGITIYESKGCDSCNFTGHIGRVAIYEFLLLNKAIRDLILKRTTANEIKTKAIECGMRTLSQSGWEKVKQGLVSPQELLRVTQEQKN